jgi:hypothetical protein
MKKLLSLLLLLAFAFTSCSSDTLRGYWASEVYVLPEHRDGLLWIPEDTCRIFLRVGDSAFKSAYEEGRGCLVVASSSGSVTR